MNIKNLIKTEIKNHTNLEYWGTEENINNENKIFDYVLKEDIVNQDWFDERLKCTSVELLTDLLEEVCGIDRDEIYSNVAQNYSELQEQYEGELSNAEIAIQPKYREEEIMLEGRATGQTRLVETTPSGFVTPSNAEAKFEAKVQELFKPEMDLNQRREQTRNVANIIKSSVAGLGSIGG